MRPFRCLRMRNYISMIRAQLLSFSPPILPTYLPMPYVLCTTSSTLYFYHLPSTWPYYLLTYIGTLYHLYQVTLTYSYIVARENKIGNPNFVKRPDAHHTAEHSFFSLILHTTKYLSDIPNTMYF